VNAARGGLDRLALLLATFFGAGRSPIIPGTAGTLASLPLAALLLAALPSWGFALATLLVIAISIPAAERASRLLGRKDPGCVVIDETAGLFVTLLGLPFSWMTLAGAFLLFRVMDVIKPQPARRAERLPGGWGIVSDDLIAGAYANLALRLVKLAAGHYA